MRADADGFWAAVERIRATDARFSEDAYAFIMEALEHTMQIVGERRHVSARELIAGACGLARDRYGMMAYTIFREWGIEDGGDIGDIVFQLVDAEVLSRQESDCRSDFNDAIDLRHALEVTYFDPNQGAN